MLKRTFRLNVLQSRRVPISKSWRWLVSRAVRDKTTHRSFVPGGSSPGKYLLPRYRAPRQSSPSTARLVCTHACAAATAARPAHGARRPDYWASLAGVVPGPPPAPAPSKWACLCAKMEDTVRPARRAAVPILFRFCRVAQIRSDFGTVRVSLPSKYILPPKNVLLRIQALPKPWYF